MATDQSSTREAVFQTPDAITTSVDNTTAAVFDHLRQRADVEQDSVSVPAWRPEVGGELVGTVRGIGSGQTRRNETHQIVTVEAESGEMLAVWLFYAVLRDQFSKADPKEGNAILFRRLEDRVNEEGKTYRDYVVLSSPIVSQHPTDDPQGDWALAVKRGGF